MVTKTIERVKLSHRALLARINRRETIDHRIVKRTRPDCRDIHDLGQYYSVDLRRNMIVAKDIDLEQYGRELKVLQPYEVMAEE